MTHYLLDPRAGWRVSAAASHATEWDRGQVRLTPLPGAPHPLSDASGTFGGLVDPLGVAVAADGTIAILDQSGSRVLRYDPCAGVFAPLPCVTHGFPLDAAQGLAFTECGDLAVADTGNRRVLLFVGAALALRRLVAAPADAPSWEPWGIAARSGGFVVTDHSGGRVHVFDAGGRWLMASDGSGPGAAPLVMPTAVAVDRRGRIYILQEGVSTVRVLAANGDYIADSAELDRAGFCPVDVAIGPTGQLCVAVCGTVCVLDDCQCPVGEIELDPPLCGLSFDRDGDPIVVGGSGQCVVRLRNGAGYPKQGEFVTEPLDGGASATVWHRVALRGCVPQGTDIRVDTLTAEAPMEAAEVIAQPDSRWATAQLVGTIDGDGWDCLIRSDPGRYLWLKLTLSGDGQCTPHVGTVEIWFPRSTSATLLPGAFLADASGGDFLQRFLSISDTQRAGLVAELSAVAGLLDPRATPALDGGKPDFLGWLASWVGMAFDVQLPIPRRRALVRAAGELYRIWGGPAAVARFVSLFCGVQVTLLEHYRLRRWAVAGQSRLGDCTELFGDAIVKRLKLGEYSTVGSFELIDTDDPLHDPFLVYASRFTVYLMARPTEQLLRLAQTAADFAKPAHTVVEIDTIEPRQRVGIQCRIGVDTVVAEVPDPGVTGAAQLGQGVVVGADPRLGGRPLAQIGKRSQIGLNTGLE